MLQTKVINDTGGLLTLKEGTAGIKRVLATFGPAKSYTINVDANATYREYWCAEKDAGKDGARDPVVLSSDDCQEYKEVTIKLSTKDNVGIYTWEGIRRDNGQRVVDNDGVKIPLSEVEAANTLWKRFCAGVAGFFRRGNS